MKNLNLEKYKTAWKKEKVFEQNKVSEQEIRKYLQKRSKNINYQFRIGIMLDIFLKTMLGLSFIGLLFLNGSQSKTLAICITVLLAIFLAIVYQIKVFKAIPNGSGESLNLKQLLQERIDFYYKRYTKVLYIGAFSNPLLIISGSMYYFYFKYGDSRQLDLPDILVMGGIILIAYIFGAFVQLKQFDYQIGQLKESLLELDEDKITELSLKRQKNKRLRMLLISILALTAGLLVFSYLLIR